MGGLAEPQTSQWHPASEPVGVPVCPPATRKGRTMQVFGFLVFSLFLLLCACAELLSSYTCIGLPWYYQSLPPQYEPEIPRCSVSCQLHNVCYNASSGMFLYYRSPNMSNVPLLISGNGTKVYNFPSDMFDLNYYSHRKKAKPKRVKLHVVYEAPSKISTIYANPYVLDFRHTSRRRVHHALAGNLGHWFFDHALPMYRLLHMFGQEEKAQPGLVTFSNFINTSAYPADTNAWVSTVLNAPTVFLNSTSPFTCFKSLTVGNKCLSGLFDAFLLPKPGMPNFHKHAANVLGIPYHNPNVPHITLNVKVGKRVPVNYFEIISAIETVFGNVEFSVVNASNRKLWPVYRQVELYSKTTLLITPGGGTSAVFPYMPAGATMLIFGYWNDKVNASVSRDTFMHLQFSHVSIKIFPVLPHEHKVAYNVLRTPTTTRRDSARGTYPEHNFVVDVSRLIDMVREELYNWHARYK